MDELDLIGLNWIRLSYLDAAAISIHSATIYGRNLPDYLLTNLSFLLEKMIIMIIVIITILFVVVYYCWMRLTSQLLLNSSNSIFLPVSLSLSRLTLTNTQLFFACLLCLLFLGLSSILLVSNWTKNHSICNYYYYYELKLSWVWPLISFLIWMRLSSWMKSVC